MSYQVIARRCRPETFEEVLGQPHVTRTLQNGVRLGRIAHAYLFSGARGVGKTSVARILAKALNCEKGPSPSPCNQCPNCREISLTNSVDVLEIDGASNRGIDSIRELRETARYRPAKGRYKVYIIDEVHQLSTDAFNALLKILEEPPAHVVFIFATTEPHKIPATVLSRCQRFEFRRLGLQMIVEHLKRIVSKEGASFSESILYAIGREADGSMRDSQSLLEQLLAFSGDDLPESEILDILGVIDRRTVIRTAEAVLSGDAGACLELAGDVYRRGLDSRRFCQHLCDHFRNLIFVTLCAGGEVRDDLPEEEREVLKALAAKTTLESLHIYFQMLLRGEEEIRRSSMPKIVLEMLLLRMCGLPKLQSIDSLLEKVFAIEQNLGSGQGGSDCMISESRPGFGTARQTFAPRQSDQSKALEPASGAGADSGSQKSGSAAVSQPLPASSECAAGLSPPLRDAAPGSEEAISPVRAPAASASEALADWPRFVLFLQNHNPILWGKVSHCTVKVQGESIELEVPEIFEKSAGGPEFAKQLEEAFLEFFGARLPWTMAGMPSGKGRGAGAKPAKAAVKASGAKQIVAHPAVQQAMEILGAELKEIKPAAGGPDKGKRR